MADTITQFLNEDTERKIASGSARKVTTMRLPVSKNSSLPAMPDGNIRAIYKVGSKGAPQTLNIPKLEIQPTTFLGRSLILYGLSNSGKTVLLNHIMYVMRDLFPVVYAVAGSNATNHSYDDIVPASLIYDKPTLELVQKIYNRQRMVVGLYNLANNMIELKKLYGMIASTQTEAERQRIERESQKMIDEAMRSNISLGEKKSKVKEQEKKRDDNLRAFYKHHIENMAESLKCKNLTKEQHIVITYLRLNPRALLLCDDVGTEINALVAMGKKQKDDVLSNFFFKGRHAGMTHFYVFQDDKGLDSGIRKNAFYSIFTSAQVAYAYFERTANNFTKEEKAEAFAAITAVMGKSLDSEGRPNFKKLVYSREAPQKFSYVVAEEHENFTMCGMAVRKFCEIVKEENSGLDKTNPFLQQALEVACKPTRH